MPPAAMSLVLKPAAAPAAALPPSTPPVLFKQQVGRAGHDESRLQAHPRANRCLFFTGFRCSTSAQSLLACVTAAQYQGAALS
jgi:hypothetical protein